ncbi:MAG: NACHT domain-containing protein, partial [Pseudomonadales bacterium]
MLDYSKINSFEAGQRESFEELVCLLAKRERPNGAIQFQRIEGSGGDGGVEALWIFDDVSKCGYQAKFFLKLGSSQWSQLDQSVKRALEVHPELKTYVIALPINLTHKRKFIGLGKSAWEKWESRVKKWSEWANEKDLSVKFEPWTSTDLTEMLYRDENQGLVRHWFGKQVLDTNWFEKNFQTAASLLEERYNPSQHVHISIEEMFDAMVRGPSTMAQIRESYREIAEQKIPSSDLERISDPPVQTEIDYAKQAWQLLLDTEKAFPSNYSEEWGTAAVGEAADAYHEALSPLYAALSNSRDKQKSDDQKNNLDEIARQLSSARSACYRLKSLTDSQKFNAEKARFAIVTGPAGVGKSHLLAHIADQRLSEGAPTILLIGQSFSDVDVWGQIGAILDISHRTSKQILGLLSPQKGRVCGLVMIDAINEGVGANYWRNRISGLLTQIAEYPNLGFVFSCREEYLKFAFPESVLDKACVFHIGGFQSTEEMEAAAETYLDAKGISRPNTPWLSPEFRNPLFLRSTSEALQAKGKVEFPKGLHGISELMSFYLDSLSMRTGVSGVDNALLAAGIKKAVRAIAEKMVETGEDFVELTSAFQIVVAEFAHLALPENTTWLDVLTRTSVLRRDPPPFDPNVNPLNPPQDRIRFAFQRFQDHLMAQAIVDQLEPDRLQDSLKPGGQLQFLLSNGDDDLEFLYVHAGLIGALSTIYPERFGIEFVDTIPKEFDLWSVDHLLQEAFETSCKWRRLDAFSERSLEILNSAEDGWVDRLSLLVEISMTIGHPWNASFLHDYLINQTISERDSYWTDWVNWASDDGGNQIQRLISWANGRAKADTQHLELAALVLSWVLTSSRRSTRDKASKALTSIFLRQSTVFQFVLEKISSCNDPYVIERLFSAAFGACCLDQSPERLSSYSKAMWESCFKGGQPPIALLTRDYALGIIELARANNCLSNDVNLDACLPPFNSAAPDLNLRKEDIERLA